MVVLCNFFSYFLAGQDGIVMAVQEGVFRTNCIDCLDRTNVVQSMLAHLTLQNQLVVSIQKYYNLQPILSFLQCTM